MPGLKLIHVSKWTPDINDSQASENYTQKIMALSFSSQSVNEGNKLTNRN